MTATGTFMPPGTASFTATRTFSVFATPTITATTAPAREELAVENVIFYPNPVTGNGNLTARVSVSKACESLGYMIYAADFRLVRSAEKMASYKAGDNDYQISSASLAGLAAGSYYCVFEAKDSFNKAKSTPRILLILK
jgi:hypothetical protein